MTLAVAEAVAEERLRNDVMPVSRNNNAEGMADNRQGRRPLLMFVCHALVRQTANKFAFVLTYSYLCPSEDNVLRL